MNVQYAIKDDTIYVLEVNPRASRTVPFVAKATGVPGRQDRRPGHGRREAGDRFQAGRRLDRAARRGQGGGVSVRPLPQRRHDPGPEMKSTGEVMGLDASFERAFAKAQLGAGVILPMAGTVFLSIKDADKKGLPAAGPPPERNGLPHPGDKGTAARIGEAGFPVTVVNKVLEGRPHCVDAIRPAKSNWSSTPPPPRNRSPTASPSAAAL